MKNKLETMFVVAITVLLFIATLKIFKVVVNKYSNVPNYSKVNCNINNEKIEIKIKKLKVLSDYEYLITSDQEEKWLLSSYFCTFVERN